MERKKLLALIGSICLTLVLVVLPFMSACAEPTPAPAPAPTPTPTPEPITLTLVSAFPKATVMTAACTYFIDEVSRRSKGELTIDWLGGAEVIDTFDQPEALATGVIDICHGVPNYYAGVVPAGHVLEVSPFYPTEQGPGTEIYDYLVEMYAEQGIRYLGEYHGALGTGCFFLFTRERVETLDDLAGLKIRVSPLTRQFIEALGAEPVTMPGGEIYLGMERGVVDGFIWPLWSGFMELSLYEVVNYCVDLPVYRGPCGVNVNLDTWNQLPEHLQDLLIDSYVDTQGWWRDFLFRLQESQESGAKEAGVEFITFLSPADNEHYTKLSHDALWEYFKGILSPERYTKLRQLLLCE